MPAPPNPTEITMKTKLTILLATAGVIATGALSSCTAYVAPPTTGAATTTTTTHSIDPYAATTTEKKTVTTQY